MKRRDAKAQDICNFGVNRKRMTALAISGHLFPASHSLYATSDHPHNLPPFTAAVFLNNHLGDLIITGKTDVKKQSILRQHSSMKKPLLFPYKHLINGGVSNSANWVTHKVSEDGEFAAGADFAYSLDLLHRPTVVLGVVISNHHRHRRHHLVPKF